MARPESVAAGGYFKTPVAQIPRIAGLLDATALGDNSFIAVCDPCAADGEAIRLLAQAIYPPFDVAAADIDPDDDAETRAKVIATAQAKHEARAAGAFSFYTCELERTRQAALTAAMGWHNAQGKRALLGDAFRITYESRDGDGVGILYLNPPYDTDKVAGRLEEKFLERFYGALAAGGVLVFVVPHYALGASAATLGRYFENVSCYRFAEGAFDIYKQVVVFAERRELDLQTPDRAIVARVQGWAESAAGIPELPAPGKAKHSYTVPTCSTHQGDVLTEWQLREIDTASLISKFAPWCETTRRGLTALSRILPDLPVAELLHRTYEVATPPRPAHIAAGLAAGLFNGRRIAPDDALPGLPSLSGLPPLLIKGVFDREWRTVEEKFNKDGEKTGELQVQQPKLVVTVLDLDEHCYHTVKTGAEATGATAVADMSVADLLKHYGNSLMGVMEQQCVILYDPRRDADKITIPPAARKLFTAQAHAVRGNVTLLRERPGESPILLGEIGSGKSIVALMTVVTYGAKRPLVLCPPHLLDSWRNEVASTLPDAEYRVLSTVADVEALRELPADKFCVAVLSREAAKLGHSVEGIPATVPTRSPRFPSLPAGCPRCGALLNGRAEERAKQHSRCEAQRRHARDDYARLARQAALFLRPYLGGGNYVVSEILQGRALQRAGRTEAPYAGLPADFLAAVRTKLCVDYMTKENGRSDVLKRAIVWAYAAAPSIDFLTKFAAVAWEGNDWTHYVEHLLALAPPGGALARAYEVAARWEETDYYGKVQNKGAPARRLPTYMKDGDEIAGLKVIRKGGVPEKIADVEIGSVEAASHLLESLTRLGKWSLSPVCGEMLYQAIPEPRRYPLAKYIAKHGRGLFDFLIPDESHEYSTSADSAQSIAAHRLVATLKVPTVFMTGTVMNGYAKSLFPNMWSGSRRFRDEFGRDELTAFVDRYGYRKRLISDREDGEVVSFGSHSDRVERSERDVGDAPGVLPLFLFRHLLGAAVTLHKADLRIELPTFTPERAAVEAEGALADEFNKLVKAVLDRIKSDRYKEGLAGKLFGQLAELPSYLDRAVADVGNTEGASRYEVRYPDSVPKVGGSLVASAKLFSASTILPKEARMLDFVEAEVKAGRNVMVFGWHLALLPRLARLLEARLKMKVPILYADKVATGKRQAWIDKEIVKKGARVMVANPVAIQTGLNNLVWFASIWWHENPACNPIVKRQADGRIDRIGQKRPTRSLFSYYDGTLQEKLYDLLSAKVAISTATDGLDPESALIAAGMGASDILTGLSIGKQLWAMIENELDYDMPSLRAVG